MPLTVIHGTTITDPRAGLAVVRDADAAGQLQRQLIHVGGAPEGLEVVTMGALRARVAVAAGIANETGGGPLATRVGLRSAARRVDLAPLGASASAPGFLSALERAVGELREADVDPVRLAEAATEGSTRTIAQIALAAGDVPFPVDGRWATARAAETLTAFPAVTLVGFDDIPPPDWALLRALGRITDVTVVMPYAAGRRAFEARHERHARWAADADVVRVGEPVGDGRDGGLAALAACLFEDVPPPQAAAGAPVRLVGAAGTRGMHRAALMEALTAHEAGVPLAECAVVVPRLADARDDLDRLAAEWGIPVRRVTRRRVVETPIGVALLALLRLGELNAGAPGALDELLRWLRSPYSGADPGEVDRFEVDARRAGLDERRELIGRWDGEAITPARRLVAAARDGVGAQIAAMVDVGWEGLRRAAGGRLPITADVLDRAALAVLGGAGADVDDDPEAAPSVERPRGPLPPGELGQVLADLTIRDEAGPMNGLQLHDYASVRGRRFRVVVLCGLDGDGVPGRPAPDPILGPLRAALADLPPPRAPGTSEQRLRFWHAVNAATERLVLVRRLVDDDGRELAPSPYWVETCRVTGRGVDDLDRRTGSRGEVLDDEEVVPCEAEVLRHLAVTGRVTAGPLAEAAGRRVRRRGVPPDAFAGVDAMRVTDLETFLRCPYGWLIDRYIGPREMERAFDAAAEGTLAHEVMQQVYAAMRDGGVGACTAATLDVYLAELERVLPSVADARRPRRAAASYEAFIHRLGVYLRLVLSREAQLGMRMRPRWLEQGLEDPRLLGVSPGITLRGTVDRIDVDDDGNLVVIDYKRSGARLRPDGPLLERLQLPLYGLLASLSLDGGSLRPAGGFYVGLLKDERDGAIRDDVPYADGVPARQRYAPADWDRLVDEARQAAMGVARDIRAGVLAAPPTRPCPPWCGCGVLWR
ncbi:MAG: PD-(D/E)XK nuclease family protein [Thermoleophilia bacterium]|nr:PD-(D/E)XK nuclease family protein [Thermoleophilia bacterium]